MISLTTKYAVRALEHLASHSREEFTSVKMLADETGIAAPYLSKVLKSLAAKELIESKKGLNGGVRLLRNGPPLTLYAIAYCLDDPVARESCFLSRQGCDSANACAFHSRWADLRVRILKFLHETVIWTPPKSDLKIRKSRSKNGL